MQHIFSGTRYSRVLPSIFFLVTWWLTGTSTAIAQQDCTALEAVFENDRSSPGALLAGCILEQRELLGTLLEADRPNAVAVLSSGSHSSTDLDHTFSVEVEKPGILIFSASGTGGLVYPETPFNNGALRIRLFIDGGQCASDYIYFSPVSGIRFDVGASCTRLVGTGTHKFRALVNENGVNNDPRLTADYVVIERAN